MKNVIRRKIENNGLIIISICIASIYWLFDSLLTGVVFTHLLMVFLFVSYGTFTQYLINSHRDTENALKKSRDGLEEQVKTRTAELIMINEELKKSERLFQTLARVSPVGIFRTDDKGNYVYVNERWCEIAGLPMEEILGEGWAKAIHSEERESVFAEWYRSVQKNRLFNTECRFQRPDGVSTWVLDQATAEINDAGEITGYVGTITDITEHKCAEEDRKESLKKLRDALGATIQIIDRMVELKDPYTAGHQKRVADLARAIGTQMGLSGNRVDGIRIAAVIHDIGKVSIPSEILNKPGKLPDIERMLIKNHSQEGYNIVKDIEFPWPVAEIILEHHERLDGSGYPQGLKGDEILLEARIVAVADVVESMASHRPYRAAHSIDEALEEITKNSGILYDHEVVNACVLLLKEKGYLMVDAKQMITINSPYVSSQRLSKEL